MQLTMNTTKLPLEIARTIFGKLNLSLVFLSILLSARAQTVPPLVNYQGRLANPDGSPLPTADYTLTFHVFDAATNGALVWGPQIFDGTVAQGHGARIPVVQGYFNVMLGPVDTTNRALSDAFNGAARYVEVTVSNRPPIAPRQQILTTPFAFQAANSAKLAGYDWSAVFGTNDPVNGKLQGTRIANGTLTSQQIIGSGAGLTNLSANSLTSGTIPDGRLSGNYFTAVTFNNGANNFLGNSVFASTISGSGAGLTSLNGTNIVDGTLGFSKHAAREVGTNVGVGGIAKSGSLSATLGNVGGAPGTNLATLTATLATSGRPVIVVLSPAGDGASVRTTGTGDTGLGVTFLRNGSALSAGAQSYYSIGGSPSLDFRWPPASFQCLDISSAGTNTYSIRVYSLNNSSIILSNVCLVAYEL